MEDKQITDEKLVEQVLIDSSRYVVLVERYQEKLARYINRLCSCQQDDIDDLLQDVFIKIFKNLNGFDKSLKFSSWAYRITHNEVISHYRKMKAQPANLELIPDLKISDDKSDLFISELENKLNKPKIATILSKMPIKYREILVLRYLEELSYDEISDIIKKPIGTVSNLLHRARTIFKKTSKSLNIEF